MATSATEIICLGCFEPIGQGHVRNWPLGIPGPEFHVPCGDAVGDATVEYTGNKFFSCEGVLLAAPLKGDGKVEWEEVCQVEPPAEEEAAKIALIAQVVGATEWRG